MIWLLKLLRLMSKSGGEEYTIGSSTNVLCEFSGVWRQAVVDWRRRKALSSLSLSQISVVKSPRTQLRLKLVCWRKKELLATSTNQRCQISSISVVFWDKKEQEGIPRLTNVAKSSYEGGVLGDNSSHCPGDRKWQEGRRTTMLPSDDGISDPAAGGSDDWMKGVVGVDYSYTIEMTQEYGGFILNPVLINKTVVRFFEAIRVFGQFVADMEPN
ncbi:unnamed protein product [Timema podura]|uniref:Peptidase M14 domain-containing protein n=1 Tax=Timema podura TaxID=61482 RepID=A0ABN7NWE3_TIMPD|nr:unnamed protein product [Timema podura]